MKKELNLEAMGVREMTRSEMIAVEGGFFKELGCAILTGVIWLCDEVKKGCEALQNVLCSR